MANKKVRVLVAGPIGGTAYKPDDVVNLPEAMAEQHANALDSNKEAVDYALSINGGKVIEHGESDAEDGADAVLPAAPAAVDPEKPPKTTRRKAR